MQELMVDTEPTLDEVAATDQLSMRPKVVFSSTLPEPLSWANSRLVHGDVVEAVGEP